MGWEKVGQKGGDSLPILKIEKPTRIRLIEGPGKYSEPQDRWQHWAEGEAAKVIKQPIACIGARTGCIFHQEPLKFRTSKQFLMNAVVYDIDAKGQLLGKKIMVISGNQIFEQMKNQCAMVSADPCAIDWLIGKTGTGKNTAYTVSMVPGDPLDGKGNVDLTQFEDQGDLGDEQYPKLIDYDKFDGFRKRTAQEQAEWYEEQMAAAEGDAEGGAAAPAGTITPPSAPAPGATITPPAAPAAAAATVPAIKMPPIATKPPAAPAPAAAPPPPAPAAAAAPPPPPAPAPAPAEPSLDELAAQPDPWGRGPWANCTEDELKFVVATDGFSPEQKAIASALLGDAPAAGSNGAAAAAVSEDALRTELGEIIKSSAALKGFANMRKFFGLTKDPNKKALANLDVNDLQSLLAIARQGDAAITAALQSVA